ncbi:MAG: hypothetical protein PHX21_01060 [bacterium]|nr:hypothetical protein [bacterium]
MIKMKNLTKMNNRILAILFLGVILSSVSFAKESLPLIDKKQIRLKNETRIFNQSANYKKNSVFAQKDTFIDNNRDGINDMLNKEKDSSPLFQFLNNKANSSLSKEKLNIVKELVETASATKPSAVEQISGGTRSGVEKIKYPKRPEKPVVYLAHPAQAATAKPVVLKKPVPIKGKTK